MDVKSRGVPTLTMFLLILFLSTCFPPHFSEANQHLPHLQKNKSSPIISFPSLVSTYFFPVRGNVYPHGYYTVTINIGNPPKPFVLDIDTGSDLTWVECDVQCTGCNLPKEQLYKPHDNLVPCADPLCVAVSPPGFVCEDPNSQCDYDVSYADHGFSAGVLVRDGINLRSIDGAQLQPVVAFGCGFDQEYSTSRAPPFTGGILGLGNGKVGILSQLHSQGLIGNVVGHCFSSKGGGFLFFGNQLLPGNVWTPIIRQSSSDQHYNLGPADLIFNGNPTSVKGLRLIFDSGSTYTYFSSQAYQAIVDLINHDLRGKHLNIAVDDPTLPLCWKRANPFNSFSDVSGYFKPLALSFPNNAQFQLPLQAYLIISQPGNVCLGILNGSEINEDGLNIIGDISMQDKIVIYDNERQQIGWVPSTCGNRTIRCQLGIGNAQIQIGAAYVLPYNI